MTRTLVLLLAALVAAAPFSGCLGATDEGGALDAESEDGGADAMEDDGQAASGDADAAPVNDTAEADGTDEAAAPHIAVTTTNGTITGLGIGGGTDAASACCIRLFGDGENVVGTFDVMPGENVTGLVVELVWDAGATDLDLGLYAPDYASKTVPELNGTSVTSHEGHYWFDLDGNVGDADAPARILVTEPEALAIAGTWEWKVRAKNAVETPFTVHVSVFHGEVPDDAYSAIA